ncbi:MAG: FAD-dependent thymidylate synthase, partial [Planctomycetota bacterium]
GKYLNGVYLNKRRYVGGNLTAWYQAAAQCEIPDPLFGLFIHEYSGLFDIDRQPLESAWKICPFDEVPEELHRYSAKFICDRGVSHELVRHRPCSFAQESTRYVNHAGKDMEFIEPAGFDNWPINCQKVFLGAVSTSEYIYNDAINHGLSPQQARAVLPNALKTELIVTADLAEWKHILKLRRHTSAQPDMVRVMIMLGDKFVEGGIISE